MLTTPKIIPVRHYQSIRPAVQISLPLVSPRALRPPPRRHLIPRSPPKMSTSTTSITIPPPILTRLPTARRILALCGAGLSASSGLPTFRGAGGLWRSHDATSLATPEAFAADPGLVWLFYAYRRHMALRAQPNAGHLALAKLAAEQAGVDFLCLSQNVDGLHVRAGHDGRRLRLLHGSLFDIKCSAGCGWVERNNFDDPLWPVLEAASRDLPPEENPLLDADVPLPRIDRGEIPLCPNCKKGLQRPGVVWFGEGLDGDMLEEVDGWIDEKEVDVVLVVGTSAVVWPAAGYVERARGRGTSVVHVNPDVSGVRLRKGDFALQGDAGKILPVLLEPVIGKLEG